MKNTANKITVNGITLYVLWQGIQSSHLGWYMPYSFPDIPSEIMSALE